VKITRLANQFYLKMEAILLNFIWMITVEGE
jgi:hypothetical protein